MKLTMNRWLRATIWAIFCLAAVAAPGQAPSTTTVTGTVYLANGQPGAGILVLSWPTFTTAAGQLIAADSTTVTIPSDGFVSVNLVPNQGATPAGEYYTAVYYMTDGSTHTQYWVVPAAASATLAAVQSQVMPAAQAVQAVSKAYVDEAIAELQDGSITSTGGSLTGPLYLNGDPTVPLQAADKHYVDTEFSEALPLTGGTLTGSLTIYSGSSLIAAFQGTSSIKFPGLAASSGVNCLQIDSSGYISNTGSACGAGGAGGGSGTVNSGTTNQVAIYSAPGTAVSGSNTLALSGTLSGAGLQDTMRPWLDTFTLSSTSSTCGSGTDEFAKFCQLELNASGSYTSSIFRSTGVSGTTVTGSVSPFAPYLTAIPFVGTQTDTMLRLAPGTIYTVPSELDIPTGGEIDGQSTYTYYGTPRTGTWLEAASTLPLAPASSAAGNVFINMGNSSSTGSSTFSLFNKLHNVGIDCMSYPWATGIEEGQSQQGMEIHDINERNCLYGLDVDNFGNGSGGAQNHGPIYKNGFNLVATPVSMGVSSFVVIAGGSYTQAPSVTITGCSTNPAAVASLSGSAVAAVTVVNTGGHGYGSGCSPGSVSVSFDTTYGSGAVATAVIQAPATPVGMRLGGIHGSGGGLYWTNGSVGSNYSISRATGMTLDNNSETILDQYAESAETDLCVGCNSSALLSGDIVIGVRGSSAQETMQNVLQVGSTSQSSNIGQFAAFGVTGSSLTNWILDNEVNGGRCRNEYSNQGGVTEYMRQNDRVISMCAGIATTGLVLANSFYNCGSCSAATQPRQYLPGKLVSGYVQTMALGDTAEPVGIGANGSFDTSNLHKSVFGFRGIMPIEMDPSVTVTAGDYVCLSTNTVVSGQSIAGGVDCGASFPPTSALGAYTLGKVVQAASSVSLSIPSTPSMSGVTVTPSTTNTISYCYEITATTADAARTESAPSTAMCTSTGPAALIARANNAIAGIPVSQTYNVYRTTLGSSTVPSLTATMAGGQLAQIGGLPAGTGFTWAPTMAFSGGSCTTEPSGFLYVVSGVITEYHITNPGAGCTGTPSITLTKSTCETGWIGQVTGTAFNDYGYCGDGTTPASGGILAPLVNVNIQYAGVPGTGDVNGPGSSTNGDLAAFNGVSGGVIKDTGVTAASLAANNAPLWLQYLGTGADGAYSLTSGTAALSGEKFYTSFNVSSGATITVAGQLIVHAAGACTVNGNILANGGTTTATSGGIAGGAGGGSGGGTSAGTAGNATYYTVALAGNAAGSGGSAGASSGGNGGNGIQPSANAQRTVTNSGLGLDGELFQGGPGKAGANSGGSAGAPGGAVILMCGSITGTGTIDVSGQNGGAVAANSTGGGSGGGGGVAILSSQSAETYTINIYSGGGAGGQASVPYTVPVGTNSTPSGDAGSIPPVLALSVSSGALSGCTVTSGGSGLGSSPSINFAVLGGGGTGGTVTPTYSGGAVTSCTASGGSGYTAASYTTAGNGGYGGAGWYAEFSGW